jgi:5-methylcytosine-specific restriction endonuclease McrA
VIVTRNPLKKAVVTDVTLVTDLILIHERIIDSDFTYIVYKGIRRYKRYIRYNVDIACSFTNPESCYTWISMLHLEKRDLVARTRYRGVMSSDPFYRSASWRDARSRQLELHPVCQNRNCGRRATNVDHRTARSKGGASLHPSNLMSLCHRCHSAKTASRDGGFGNTRTSGSLPAPRGCDADGYPLAWSRPDRPQRRP